MTRPPDRFTDRITTWEQLANWIETGEGRTLEQNEEARLYSLFTRFLPEHRGDYPRDMPRLEVWYARQEAFMELQAYVDEVYNGDYDLSDFIDDEADWRENYEQIPQ